MCSVSLCAQSFSGTPAITNFSRTDYHAGTQNWAIAQDSRGIMYFGNNKGLLEFDGANWQIFPLPNRTIVRSLACSNTGNIYIGGQDEIGYIKMTTHQEPEYISLTHLIPSELKGFEDIWKIFIFSDKVLFCSQKYIFQLKNNVITPILPGNSRFENFFKFEEKVYVQIHETGLFQLEDDVLNPIRDGEIFANTRIVAILPYNLRQILIVTAAQGLFLMNEVGIHPYPTAASAFLTKHQAYCALQLTDKRYAIGTAQNGLLIIDTTGTPEVHVNATTALQNNTILSLYQDVQQNLWVGLDNGIDYIEINSPFSTIQSDAGIGGTGYASIVHKDKLYLGTNQGLFYGNLNVKPLQFYPVQNAAGQVWNLHTFDENLMSCQHKGISLLTDNGLRSLSTVQGAWKFIQLSQYSGYAIEGTYIGLYLYKIKIADSSNSPDWQSLGKINGFDESARVFEEDENGNIWVSHAYKGLYKIQLSKDLRRAEDITFYTTDYGLPANLFINVCKIYGELVFTTPKGIYTYKKENDRFVEHEEFSDIFGKNRNIHRLVEDENGNIWFSIDNDFGVLKVKEKGVFNKLEANIFSPSTGRSCRWF